MLTQIVLISLLRAQSGLQEQAWDVPGIEAEDNTPEVLLVSAKQRRECSRPGAVCLAPGGSATSEGVEVREDAPPIMVLARGAQVAAVGALQELALNQPWQVEMVADFKSRSADGPIIVAVMDGESPEAMANHQALVVWDVNMKPGKNLGDQERPAVTLGSNTALSVEPLVEGSWPADTVLIRFVKVLCTIGKAGAISRMERPRVTELS